MPQKLELTWYGKDEPLQIEPRLLIENAELSNCKPKSKTENMLIHGDNLLALKALESQFAGKIKCIYIDPPYNTGSAMEHYDDNLEHSIWLNLIRPRLEILRSLLSEDGVLFVSIDEHEFAYLTVLLDEIFGRKNNCGQFIWEKKKKPSFLDSQMGCITEFILAYAKNISKAPSFIGGVTTEGKKYPLNNAGNGIRVLQFPAGSVRFNCPDQIFEPQDMSEGNIITRLLDRFEIINGVNIQAFRLEGEWRYSQSKLDSIIAANEQIIISKAPFRPNHIKTGGEPKKIKNLLSIAHYQMSTYEDATAESRALFGISNAFDYPKPEKLIYTLINAVTHPGDLVLDSFLGSGTTAAVAHKMGRRWIGIEMGDHAYSHCKVRLDKVIAGEENGGISKDVQWQGGGEYRFFELAPSLINLDPFGEPVINSKYNADMLAAAVALHEGYMYQPDEIQFWKQSVSSEKSWLFVTTRHVTVDYLSTIAASMAKDDFLFIAACSFDSEAERAYKQISVKKIPDILLKRCTFGKNDYNLNIVHPPIYEDEDEE